MMFISGVMLTRSSGETVTRTAEDLDAIISGIVAGVGAVRTPTAVPDPTTADHRALAISLHRVEVLKNVTSSTSRCSRAIGGQWRKECRG